MPCSSHQRTSASSRPCVDPDFARRRSRGSSAVSSSQSAVVGDDQRQFDAALLGALADAHPAGGEARHGIGKAPRPAVGKGRGRADHDGAGEIALRPPSTVAGCRSPRSMPWLSIIVAELRQRAVDDRSACRSRRRASAGSPAAPCRAHRRRPDGCARETAATRVRAAWRSPRVSGGWRNTGRPNVASVMNTSQRDRLEGRAGRVGAGACSRPRRRCACRRARPRSAPSRAHGRPDGR